MDYYYRYSDIEYADGRKIRIEAVPILKRTVKGVWIGYSEDTKRWVGNDWKKQWACPDVESAQRSYLARKRRQVAILRARLAEAETFLNMAKAGQFEKYVAHFGFSIGGY